MCVFLNLGVTLYSPKRSANLSQCSRQIETDNFYTIIAKSLTAVHTVTVIDPCLYFYNCMRKKTTPIVNAK